MEIFNREKAVRLVKSYFLIHTFGTVWEIIKFGEREHYIKDKTVKREAMELILGVVKELSEMKVLSEDNISYNNYTLLSDIKGINEGKK